MLLGIDVFIGPGNGIPPPLDMVACNLFAKRGGCERDVNDDSDGGPIRPG